MLVAIWMIFEAQFMSSADYENPVQDIQLEVDFTSPDGVKHTVFGFWDGGRTWRVRFSPEELGKWKYKSRSSDAGLHEQYGEFECVPYSGENPLYRHGAVQVSENRRYLTHSDDTPFFWLADTAWNGALLSTEEDWKTFLQDRVSKDFTAIQFVTTQWRAAAGDAEGRLAFTGKEKIRINPEFYQRMDQRINAINNHGLIAAPILIWTCTGIDPGQTVPNDQLTILAEYMVARYGAHQVIWMLGGDGDYRGEKADRWREIGRAVFGSSQNRLATMHPGGQQWVADEFRNESWFSFNGYQSGHGDSDGTFRWLYEGPPAQNWKKEPHHPIINLEPNYEAHRAYQSKKPHDAHAVRRAAYWSLLVSPPAGITYGAHGIWSWEIEQAEPMGHKGSGIAQPWYEVAKLPGSTDMKHLRRFFSSIEWWQLLPAQKLLAEQPGSDAPSRFVAAAKSMDDSWAVLYMPVGLTVTLNMEMLKEPTATRWFNPRTGEWLDVCQIDGSSRAFVAPDDEDWVLWISSKIR